MRCMDASALGGSRRLIGQRLFISGLLLVFTVLGVQYSVKALKNRSAFMRWRDEILQIDQTNIYERFQYPNPPIMALLLRPLAELEPPWAGAVTWFFLKVAMALLSLAMVFRLIEDGGVPFPPWAKAVATLLSLRPLVGDLSHGNVNIFILFLVIAALYSWHKERDLLAGVLLALAVCCKVTPALFVPYFVWKRQWNLLAGWAIGMGMFLLIVPAVFLGWSENWGQLSSWVNQMIVPFVIRGEVTSEHPNQSLPGLVFRLMTHNPSFVEYPNNIWTPAEYHNLVDLGQASARWLIRGCQVLFLLIVFRSCRNKERGGWRVALEFSMILVGMLLFSERTWKHHCVTLTLPFAALVYVIAVAPVRRWLAVSIASALGLAALLMFSASGILSVREADLMQVYGAYTAAFVILLGALVVAVNAERQIPAAIGLVPPTQGDNRSLIQPVAVSR
jgi:hypothetical protein